MKLFTSFFLLFLMSFSVGNDDEKMPWNESRRLTWNDFQGVPQAGTGFVASTNSGISFSYSYSVNNGKMDLEYTIQSNFYPKLSWFKKEDVSDYILLHEQTHFDISELHARKLRKQMKETKFSLNPKKEINSIYNENERQRRAMQQRFDTESDHSKIPEAEYKWRTYVAGQLQKYASWK